MPNYYYHFILLRVFLHQRWLMVSHWSLSDSNNPRVSRTLLRILTDLNIVIVGWSSLVLLFLNSSIPVLILGDCIDAPIKIGSQSLPCSIIFENYYYYYYFTPCESFTGVWIIASVFRCPGLFSVFWQISTILQTVFLWFPFVLIYFRRLWIPFQVLQIQLSPSCKYNCHHLCRRVRPSSQRISLIWP